MDKSFLILFKLKVDDETLSYGIGVIMPIILFVLISRVLINLNIVYNLQVFILAPIATASFF
ncbi:MAG TPA: hypothetical protein DCQ68_08430 [Chryseobacterium indologenes]|nr:hypothetical protein [Chryseobacterium indologenes]